MFPLYGWGCEAHEDAEQRELDEQEDDQQLGVQLNAQIVDGGDQDDGDRRHDMHGVGWQALDYLRRVNCERQRDDDGGDDAFAQVGAAGDEPDRVVTEFARPGERAAFVREFNAYRGRAEAGRQRHQAAGEDCQ